jgi:hypothetical protein
MILRSTRRRDLSAMLKPSNNDHADPRTSFASRYWSGRTSEATAGPSEATAGPSGLSPEVDGLTDDATGARWRGFTKDTQALLVSVLFHCALILSLALFPVVTNYQSVIELIASVNVEDPEFELFEEIVAAEFPSEMVGANSDSSSSSMALSSAQIVAEISEVPAPSEFDPMPNATVAINPTIPVALGAVRSTVAVKGSTGVGETGLDGAVDRLTYELLRAMEANPTLVVWYFDQSISLTRQREQIRDRFDRIYEELGIVSRARRSRGSGYEEDRLLTAVIGFGQQAQLLTPRPTADLEEIRQAIDSIPVDPSGVENTFTAMQLGLNKFRSYRTARAGRGEARSIVFVVVTDERGDDGPLMEGTLRDCLRFSIPVYVLGVPAPFGRATTEIKYVDPDPQFDQSPQWGVTDQGPESLLPERVRFVYRDEDRFGEPVVDSGFGPYALSRLTYETGGIFFNIHPNRRVGSRVSRGEIDAFASDLRYFFDPEIMEKYRPDYVSEAETLRRIQESPIRNAVIQASRNSAAILLDPLSTRFVKRDEASLVNQLSEAQQVPARISYDLEKLATLLQSVESSRDREISPRWLASYDLSYGTTLASLVRFSSYNEMLARAKRGMKFEEANHNTWVLTPSASIDGNSRLEKLAQKATELLKQVSERHAETPWGLLAERELGNPMGWAWTEQYTELNPPPAMEGATTPNPPTPNDDQRRMLPPPPPKRPLPKL